MKFTKMHGLGNDFVCVSVFDEHVGDPQALARTLSNRRLGVGGDGLILIGPSECADLRMTVYNADGSRAQMCGNGIRCVAKYAVERLALAGPDIRIETDAGVKSAHCSVVDGAVRSVRVDMGLPSLCPASLPAIIDADRIVDYPLNVAGAVHEVTCVSMGNPHAVVFVEELDSIALDVVGPQFEHAPPFPERINAHFVRVDSLTHLTMISWERGSGATCACGTGACGACVAGVLTGKTERAVTATLPGGDLQLDWADDNHVYMTGPAEEVFTGQWLKQRRLIQKPEGCV